MAVKIKNVFSYAATGAVTSVAITGLDGNTDIAYCVDMRIIGGTASNILIRLNGDSGTSNYGYQILYAVATTGAAVRGTYGALLLAGIGTSGDANQQIVDIFAKSGYVRTSLTQAVDKILTTTVTDIRFIGGVWNNTADNITSMSVLAEATGGIGTGSTINVYTRTTV